MKNILTVFAVLAMASVANAGMKISVDGAVDLPDSSITIDVGSTVVIDFQGDQTANLWMLVQGPAEMDALNPTFLWEQSDVLSYRQVNPDDLEAFKPGLADMGYPGVVDIIESTVADLSDPITTPDGVVVDGIIFKCLEEGDVVLTLTDVEFSEIFDTVTIHQIPEPMTLGLLGLGGLFLRRRR